MWRAVGILQMCSRLGASGLIFNVKRTGLVAAPLCQVRCPRARVRHSGFPRKQRMTGNLGLYKLRDAPKEDRCVKLLGMPAYSPRIIGLWIESPNHVSQGFG
jgi:hypothetical protein